MTDNAVQKLSRPLKIGGLTIPNRVLLAPLAGVTDVPFRRIMADYGAGLTYVEMLVSVAVVYKSKKTLEMMSRHASEKQLGVQLTGRNVDEVKQAAEILDTKGFDTIDINMGCPVRKVVNSGSGSAFLKDLDRITNTLEAVRSVTSMPFTAKCRLGFTLDAMNIADTATRIAQAGCDMITIHGRTRQCTYASPVQHDMIKAGAKAARDVNPNIPVIGNGNVFDLKSAEKMLNESGVDGVMISRGALGNPWIFTELTDPDFRQPDSNEWLEVVMKHIEYHREHYGDSEPTTRMMRKHLIWYANGFPHSSKLRRYFNTVTTLEDAQSELADYVKKLPKGIRRYEAPGTARVVSKEPKYEMDRKLDRGVGNDGPETSTLTSDN